MQVRRTVVVWMLLWNRDLLAETMAEQRVSQRQLARAAGLRSHGMITQLLNGERNSCAPATAIAIAKHLGLPLGQLFASRISNSDGQVVRERDTVVTPRQGSRRRPAA